MIWFPATCSFACGKGVPMPTLPCATAFELEKINPKIRIIPTAESLSFIILIFKVELR
jgi:hypothetical protein